MHTHTLAFHPIYFGVYVNVYIDININMYFYYWCVRNWIMCFTFNRFAWLQSLIFLFRLVEHVTNKMARHMHTHTERKKEKIPGFNGTVPLLLTPRKSCHSFRDACECECSRLTASTRKKRRRRRKQRGSHRGKERENELKDTRKKNWMHYPDADYFDTFFPYLFSLTEAFCEYGIFYFSPVLFRSLTGSRVQIGQIGYHTTTI